MIMWSVGGKLSVQIYLLSKWVNFYHNVLALLATKQMIAFLETAWKHRANRLLIGKCSLILQTDSAGFFVNCTVTVTPVAADISSEKSSNLSISE